MLAQEKPFIWPLDSPALNGYQLIGTEPGGLFLHGFRSHCNGEKAVGLASHAVTRGRSWFRYNQRYCGRTNDEFARFTISQAITDAVAVLDLLRQPVILVGSSLGAVIALQVAQQRPELVVGLLLIAPAIRFVERHFMTLPTGETDLWCQQGSKLFQDYYEGGFYPLDYAFYEDALNYKNMGPWKFRCPVSILHGEKDELIPPADSRELRQRIDTTSVTLEIVADGDHRLNGAIPLMCMKLDDLWQMT